MTTHIVRRPRPTVGLTTGGWVTLCARSARAYAIGLAATIDLWIRRSRTRGALARLLEDNDHRDGDRLLRDIGATRDEALREIAKWFWQH